MKKGLGIVGLICLLIGLDYLKSLAIVAELYWQDWGLSSGLLFNLIWGLFILAVIALAIYLAKRYSVWDFSKTFLTWKNLGWSLLIFLAMRLLAILGAMVTFLEQGGFSQTENDGQILAITASQPLVITFLLLVVLAPVVEEIVYRGLLMSVLFKGKAILGILVSSILFGAIHVPTTIGAWLTYAGMGLVLALAYHKTKSLSLVIAGHALNNLLAFIAMIALV